MVQAMWVALLSIGLAACELPNVKKLAPPTQAKPASPEQSQGAPAPTPAAPRDGAAVPQLPSTPEEIVLTPPAIATNQIAVGLLLPLTGQSAVIGRSLLDAAQLALFEVADENFVLVPRDTAGTPGGAVTAATAAIEAGAKMLLGPIFSASALAVAPLAREAGVNMVAFTNNQSAAGDGAYVMGFLPSQRIERVVSFAASRNATRFAALLPEGPYGDRARDAFLEAVERAGASMVRIERYDDDPQSAADAVKRLGNYDSRRASLLEQRKALAGADDEISRRALKRLENLETLGDVDFDAVLVLETGEALKGLVPLLPYYDIDIRRVRVLGIDDWSSRSLRREPALSGAWFASPPLDAASDFMARFKQIYSESPHPLAPLAYDATALAAVLASRDAGGDFSVEALTAPNGFAGSAGLFRLLRSGLVEHQFAVFEVDEAKVRTVSEAPQAFEILGN